MTGHTDQWHLDKKVPIAILLALFLQFGGWVWWAASLNGRVTATENAITQLDTRTETLRGAAQTQAIQLGRIEEQIGGLRQDIGRLLTVIERNAP